jgi:hypothetical protein
MKEERHEASLRELTGISILTSRAQVTILPIALVGTASFIFSIPGDGGRAGKGMICRIRAFGAQAKDEEATCSHEHFDFIPSLTDPLPLFVLLEDVRRIIWDQDLRER